MEPLPIDDFDPIEGPQCDFEDFDPFGADPEPGGQVIIGPWPARPADRAAGITFATWRQRARAALIDTAAFLPFLIALTFNAVAALVLLTLAVAFSAWQICSLQGRTGQTLGKRRVGLFLVREADLRPIGARRAALRQLAHGIDAALLGVGFLWPLWDAKHQTFADQVFATVVAAS